MPQASELRCFWNVVLSRSSLQRLQLRHLAGRIHMFTGSLQRSNLASIMLKEAVLEGPLVLYGLILV